MKLTKKFTAFLTIVLLFTGLSFVYGATNEESALSWQKNAKDTRAAVVSVYGELEKIGDKGNPDAKDLIADAVKWLGEGDKELAKVNGKVQALITTWHGSIMLKRQLQG